MNGYCCIAKSVLAFALLAFGASSVSAQYPPQRQITHLAQGHMLTNIAVWSPDSNWIVYDTRTSLDGSVFNGQTIERVHVESGKVEQLYQSRNGAFCGVVTYHPKLDQVVFIHGPENPSSDWQYGPARRQGVVVDCDRPGIAVNLDARDLTPPYTSGALRGGTHVHTFSGDGRLVASTYEDAILDLADKARTNDLNSSEFGKNLAAERNLRGIALSIVDHPVEAPSSHPRNHSGSSFTLLATELWDTPLPGSEQIMRACEEGWIGTDGYRRADGTHQKYAIAFQGTVIGRSGKPHVEVFVLEIDSVLERLTQPVTAPLTGTPTTRPRPAKGVRQRRVTHTDDRMHPGVTAAPRHWLRSSPDGDLIFFLAKDDSGVAQVFSVPTLGGDLRQITRDNFGVASAFSLSPDGKRIAYVADGSLFVADLRGGQSTRLTPPDSQSPLRPEAVVFSPDGRKIAFLRTVPHSGQLFNQVYVVNVGG